MGQPVRRLIIQPRLKNKYKDWTQKLKIQLNVFKEERMKIKNRINEKELWKKMNTRKFNMAEKIWRNHCVNTTSHQTTYSCQIKKFFRKTQKLEQSFALRSCYRATNQNMLEFPHTATDVCIRIGFFLQKKTFDFLPMKLADWMRTFLLALQGVLFEKKKGNSVKWYE